MKFGSTETHLSSRVSRRMGHTFATTFLPRICCQEYSGYPRVSFLSFDRTAPQRFEHATPSLSWSERYSTSFLKHGGRRIHRILTQWTIYSTCSVLQEKVYPSRIADVDELKTRLIDDWEYFHQ